MAFQIKDMVSITASMVNYIRGATARITDFSVGSVVRTLLEASAIEIDELYQRLFHGLKEAIQTSVFRSFAFAKRDGENDEEWKARFVGWVASLPRATPAAIEYGAKTAALAAGERVVFAKLDEPFTRDAAAPVGQSWCYVHNGTAATTADLVARAQQVVDGYYDESGTAVPGWKAAGVRCGVIAATDVPVDVVGDLGILPGYDRASVIASATAAAEEYLRALDIGERVSVSCLEGAIRGVPGTGCVKCSVPAGNVEIPIGHKAIPGAVALA